MDPLEGKMTDTPRSESISTKQQRIATMDSEVANPCPEEPDAGNPHVRICGGLGATATLVYPTTEVHLGREYVVAAIRKDY